jgi:hypothetical protein
LDLGGNTFWSTLPCLDPKRAIITKRIKGLRFRNHGNTPSLGEHNAHEVNEMKVESFLQINYINSFGSCNYVAHIPSGLMVEGQIITLQRLCVLQV